MSVIDQEELSRISKSINDFETQLLAINNEVSSCKRFSESSFSFTSNWRDKDSFAKRIPILKKQSDDLTLIINILRAKKETIERQLQQEQATNEQKQAIKIAKDNKITNPILL